MYTFKELYARPRRTDGRWKKVSVSKESTLLDLPGRWGEVVLVIAYNNGQVEKSITFEALRTLPEFTKIKASTTIESFLTELGNKTLPFDERRFTLEPRYTFYRNLTHDGYKIEPVGRHASSTTTPSFGGSDLLIKSEVVNGKHIGQYGVFSVNGFYHLSDYDSHGVYIHDGNKTVRRSNECEVGIMDFERIGKVKHIPITSDMLKAVNSDTPFKEMLYLRLPQDSVVEGYSYLFFIGGYLVPVGEGITRVSDRSFRIDIQKLNLLERFFDSQAFLNTDDLKLTKYPDYLNDGLMSMDEFFGNEVLTRYLTSAQSFVVAVETPRLFHDSQPIDSPTPFTGVIEASLFDNQPLLGVNGRQVEYHPVQRDDTITLHCLRNTGYNYAYVHRPWRKQKAVDRKCDIDMPLYTGGLYLRLLGSDA